MCKQPMNIDFCFYRMEAKNLLPTKTLTHVYLSTSCETESIERASMWVKLCRKDVLTTAVGFAKALLKWNLEIFPANKCTRLRKTFLDIAEEGQPWSCFSRGLWSCRISIVARSCNIFWSRLQPVWSKNSQSWPVVRVCQSGHDSNGKLRI